MGVTIEQLIVWLIVGALVGSFTGMLMTRSRHGYGRWTNLGIGLAGAIVGGFLFNLFHIDLGFGKLAISFQDLVSSLPCGGTKRVSKHMPGRLKFLTGICLLSHYPCAHKKTLKIAKNKRRWHYFPYGITP